MTRHTIDRIRARRDAWSTVNLCSYSRQLLQDVTDLLDEWDSLLALLKAEGIHYVDVSGDEP